MLIDRVYIKRVRRQKLATMAVPGYSDCLSILQCGKGSIEQYGLCKDARKTRCIISCQLQYSHDGLLIHQCRSTSHTILIVCENVTANYE